MKTFNVQYKGMIATVDNKDFDETVEVMRTDDGKDRMQSIISALEKSHTKLSEGEDLTSKERQNLANDIALWYAHEVANNNAPRHPKSN